MNGKVALSQQLHISAQPSIDTLDEILYKADQSTEKL